MTIAARPSSSSVGAPPSHPHYHAELKGAPPSSGAASPASDQTTADYQKNDANHISNFEMSDPIRRALQLNFKIENLFPIQAECYNPIVSGKDLIGRSRTGTGKTLAFVLPVVERLRHLPPQVRDPSSGHRRSGVFGVKPRVLILEPTRELANQVNQEILKLSHVRTAVLYGGASSFEQERSLRGGVEIVVATPGRLLDFVRRGTLSLDDVKTVILDEADEMLRMGFQEQVEEVMSFMQHEKQVLLFSATLPDWVNNVSRRYLREPTLIDKVTGQENSTPSTIVHKAICTPTNLPSTAQLIKDIFKTNDVKRAIIFTKTKRDAGALAEMLNEARVYAEELHGDVAQSSRDRTMANFRSGRLLALVATDVAARGIDVPNVDMVLHCGFPQDTSFYVHRSGRTGRAGKLGTSVLMYHQADRAKIVSLAKEMGVKFSQMHPPPTSTNSVRSALSMRENFVTILIRERVDMLDLESVLRTLSDTPTLILGQVTKSVEGTLTEIPVIAMKNIQSKADAGDAQAKKVIAINELPSDLFAGSKFFAASLGHGRSGGSSRPFGRDRFSSGGDRGFSRDRSGHSNGRADRGDRGERDRGYQRESRGSYGRDRDFNRDERKSESGSFSRKW